MQRYFHNGNAYHMVKDIMAQRNIKTSEIKFLESYNLQPIYGRVCIDDITIKKDIIRSKKFSKSFVPANSLVARVKLYGDVKFEANKTPELPEELQSHEIKSSNVWVELNVPSIDIDSIISMNSFELARDYAKCAMKTNNPLKKWRLRQSETTLLSMRGLEKLKDIVDDAEIQEIYKSIVVDSLGSKNLDNVNFSQNLESDKIQNEPSCSAGNVGLDVKNMNSDFSQKMNTIENFEKSNRLTPEISDSKKLDNVNFSQNLESDKMPNELPSTAGNVTLEINNPDLDFSKKTDARNIKLDILCELFIKHSGNIACIYILDTGLKEGKLDVYKYGYTNSLDRRIKQHRKTFGEGLDIKHFCFVDLSKLAQAECDLKDCLSSFVQKSSHKKFESQTELLFLDVKSKKNVKTVMETIYARYGHENVIEYERKIFLLESQLQSIKHELELYKKDSEIKLQEALHQSELLKLRNELLQFKLNLRQ